MPAIAMLIKCDYQYSSVTIKPVNRQTDAVQSGPYMLLLNTDCNKVLFHVLFFFAIMIRK